MNQTYYGITWDRQSFSTHKIPQVFYEIHVHVVYGCISGSEAHNYMVAMDHLFIHVHVCKLVKIYKLINMLLSYLYLRRSYLTYLGSLQ